MSPATGSFTLAVPKPPPGKQGVMNPNTTVYRGVTKKIELVRPDQCSVDLEVQRPEDKTRIAALAKKWNDVAAGICYVSRRPDGSTVVLDGQTRFGALMLLGLGDRPRETVVYRGLNKPQEAEIFRILNNTKRPDALCLFNIGCVEGVEENLKIRALIRKHGYEPWRSRKNSLIAIRAVVDAYRRDVHSTEATLKFCHDTWGNMKDAVNGTIVAGLSLLIFRYGADVIDFEQLSDRIRKNAGGDPTSLIGRAKTNADIRSCNLPDALADILTNTYNKGPGKKKLPDWVTGR
jgi:hypothetical protein